MPAPATHTREQGFTLVELSIVLVIIGLIVGGVLVGRDLMEAAQARSVIREIDQIKSTIYTFKNKFGQFPGDFRNAYAVWGSQGGCTNQDSNIFHTGCNGNGDGTIAGVAGSGSIVAREGHRAWQHLGLADLIPGNYSGILGTQSPGVDLPASRIQNSVYALCNVSGMPTILLSSPTGGNQHPLDKTISPSLAYVIDRKIDDGNPYTGSVRGTLGYNADASALCVKAHGSNWIYDRSNSGVNCRMEFRW